MIFIFMISDQFYDFRFLIILDCRVVGNGFFILLLYWNKPTGSYNVFKVGYTLFLMKLFTVLDFFFEKWMKNSDKTSKFSFSYSITG